MATNYVQAGKVLDFSAPYDRTTGQGFQVGSIFAVALGTALSTVAIRGQIDGVWTLAKTSAQAWTVGQKLFWDNTNKRLDSDSTVGMLVGVAQAVAANPSSTGNVRLNGVAPATAEGAQGAIVALTDSTGLSGTHDDTLAATAALVTLTDSTGDSATHNDTLADGSTITAALTDSTTGAAGDTLAAGAGHYVLPFQLDLADIADGDLVTDWVIGHKFTVIESWFVATEPVTTGAKATTLSLDIGATVITNSQIALTSANCTPVGIKVANAGALALNTGAATDTLTVKAASTTAFAEGKGVLLVHIQNMDTADAVASIAAKVNLLRTDNLVQNQNDSDLAQKAIEIVTQLAVTNQNISDVAQKILEIRTALIAAGILTA